MNDANAPLGQRVTEQSLLITNLQHQVSALEQEVQTSKQKTESAENKVRELETQLSSVNEQTKSAKQRLDATLEDDWVMQIPLDSRKCLTAGDSARPAGRETIAGENGTDIAISDAETGALSNASSVAPSLVETSRNFHGSPKKGLHTPRSDILPPSLVRPPTKRQKGGPGPYSPSQKQRDEWTEILKVQYLIFTSIQPYPGTDKLLANEVLSPMVLGKRNALKFFEQYKMAPDQKRQNWQCLNTIIINGHKYASKINSEIQCEICTGDNWCVQVRSKDTKIVFRMVGKVEAASPKNPIFPPSQP